MRLFSIVNLPMFPFLGFLFRCVKKASLLVTLCLAISIFKAKKIIKVAVGRQYKEIKSE